MVPRFCCLVCGQGFSSRTFDIDYCVHGPIDDRLIQSLLVGGSGLRQAWRSLCGRRSAWRAGLERQRVYGLCEASLREQAFGGRVSLDSWQVDPRRRRIRVPVQ